jgi:hypothetical protein
MAEEAKQKLIKIMAEIAGGAVCYSLGYYFCYSEGT